MLLARLGWMRVAALAGLCALGCGDDPESVGALGGIHGTVRDEATKARLKGAKVVFRSDTLETSEGRTDEDGAYELSIHTRSAKGRIEVTKSGYQTKIVSVFLDDTTVQIDVDLPRAN